VIMTAVVPGGTLYVCSFPVEVNVVVVGVA
jgi:hypothetical protein